MRSRSFSPWVVRRACRWTAVVLALLTLLVTVPLGWTMLHADASVADNVCRATRGCEQAYFCSSNAMALRPHPALCVQGAFANQEVDAAGWHDGLEAALPTTMGPLVSDTMTVRWIGPAGRTPR